MFLDMGDDGDPWTIQTETTASEAVVDIVFEVPEGFVPGSWFYVDVIEGCCEDAQEIGHYGVSFGAPVAAFDPAYVDAMDWGGTTCLCCNVMYLGWHFAPDADLVVGERYVIGTVPAHANCDMDPGVPCEPPHHVVFDPWDDGPCIDPAPLITFICPAVPDATMSWSRIKALYR